MTGSDLGFDPRRLSMISIDPVRDGYSAERAETFFRKLLERVQARPSIAAASLADSVPMAMIGKTGAQCHVLGQGDAKVFHRGRKYVVSRGFFDTLGIPVLRGRGFRQEDEGIGSTAVVVSEKLARDCWKGEDPLGRRMEIGAGDIPSFQVTGASAGPPRILGKPQVYEVVGVVKNVRDGLDMVPANAPGVFSLPLGPADYARPSLQGMTLIVRAAPGVDAIGEMRREIAALDDRLTPFNARGMPEQIDRLLFPVKVALWTYGAIGICGLILASIGLAGVTAYSVTRRRREIGIRVALGAGRADVLGLVMKEGAVLILLGTAIGLAAAHAGIQALSAVLSTIASTAGTSASDPALLVGAPLLLAALALAACYLPARQSLRIDPAVALRQE
ncbi:MAG: FtsX-like permease family protein [Acidobacteriia bacterium]|nr:FtsX-like permease family protein [Terriglobia bacterium]